jgi:hypothetical protein
MDEKFELGVRKEVGDVSSALPSVEIVVLWIQA